MKLNNELYTIVDKTDNSATIRLLPESGIFKAHFPGNPVTPGVCQVGMIEELAEEIRGVGLVLQDIKSLKFIDILHPTKEEVEVVFDKLEVDGDVVTAKGTVTSCGRIFTKFSLLFGIEA